MAIEFGSILTGNAAEMLATQKTTAARSVSRLTGASSILQAPSNEDEESISATGFEDAMLKALDGVNTDQLDASGAIETFLINPDSIEAHDVTIAMAKANLSLNITRTVLDRVVRAWRDLINTR
ncbi:MAG: flagellar hook-basal body complex protein FliE [Spirochaetales bacterium]|nr:MAG: flagellar hook-basal body complex protein FliE [Spirochaetales bacterium]